MKKFHEVDRFQHQSVFVRADLLISRGISVEAVALFIAGCVPLVRRRLAVILSSDDDRKICLERCRFVDIFYSQCQKAANLIKNYCIDVSVRFSGSQLGHGWEELVPSIRAREVEEGPTRFIVKFPHVIPLLIFPPLPLIEKTYNRVLFAGTFDHLHSGHKSIITQSLFLAEDTLYVAVTSEQLLLRKKCPAAIEPFDSRVIGVDNFIRSIVPDCKKDVEIVILETPDAIGPAGHLDFDAIIVTPETLKGGEAVNEARVARGNKPVEIVTLQILDHLSVECKLSSTNIRAALCNNLARGEDDLNELHDSFISEIGKHLMDEMSVKTLGTTWWSRLRDIHGLEPWRHYHNLRHVFELIAAAREHYEDGSAPIELWMAIWFHDCVYIPRSATNEEDSVQVFEEFAQHAEVPSQTYENVRKAILYSKSHLKSLNEIGVEEWIKVFLELDLSILASEDDRYSQYKAQIRSEYSHFDDTRFRAGRKEFLEGISQFRFKYLRNKDDLNDRITKNVSQEISELS
jgi:phosphopantetheine adenylyltransferase/predicted metal-dependent HD superfamily phosphohydrolase